MSGLMLPEQCFRLRVMHRLTLTGQPAFLIIPVMHRHPVPFADMADVCQPATFVILPPLCGFTLHGAVREAVCFVIVPVGDHVGQPFHGGQAVRYTAVRQSLCVVRMSGLMLPEQFIRLRMMHRQVFTGEAAFTVITIVHRHPVPFADMADVCQPAAFVILPPLCGFAIHGAVREAVCFVIVPVGDQGGEKGTRGRQRHAESV
ncbi:hypothetical protein K3831_22950 [Escherichia coli]|nr:hypothetical protein K3831_22950 [Escherichia coli]